MKEFRCRSNIGAGLFAEGTTPIELHFPDGTVATFNVRAMTQDLLVDLQKSGVKFEDFTDNADALANSTAIIEAIVESGQWGDVEIGEGNRHRIVSNIGLTAALINAARALAEEIVEEDLGNSVISSDGSLPPTAENTGGSSSEPISSQN
jgi:hypothetical protein